ncbi:uncharacterized protein LOC143883165 [Tasmannia lanceolata]|uniref:uncharacterized protein LOC143883165 n=1 Tax=Tasmannia lanceolata TaxID=3420 RepID=UPI0040649739
MHVNDAICEDGNEDFDEDDDNQGVDQDGVDDQDSVHNIIGDQDGVHNIIGYPFGNTYTREPMEVDEMVVDELNVGRIGLEELKVGGIFPNLKVFKNKVREYAIDRRFVFVPVDSKPTKYAVRCKNGSCPFRISGTNYLDCVRVNRFVPEHTCSSTRSGNDHPLATESWAAETCLGLFPRPGDVTPSSIRAYVKDKWSIILSYTKAFNAKVIIHEIMCGNAEASYRILPAYAQEMEICNPGTIMRVYRTRQLWGSGDDTFGRLFWSFGPSIRAFSRTVRPLILIDGTHLRGKYKGILLAATTLDGDGGLFPLAFAVVENENFDSWLWFLLLLRQRVMPVDKNNNEFTISSDRMKGLVRAVAEALPGSYHSYCIHHLNANLLKTFKSQKLCKLFSRAAYALRESDHKEAMKLIKAKNEKAEKWISEIPKENWANVHFKGARWNVLTTNAAKCFNNVLKGARKLPIAALVDHTRWKVQDFFHFRRKAGAIWKTHLTHRAEKWLDRSCSFGSKFLPRTCSWNEYEVLSSTHTDSVDLEKKTSTCGLFQTMGLPCGHAIAAMRLNKLDRYKYCQDWFLASTYRSTYEEMIHPTLDRTQWPEPSYDLLVLLPLRVRRQPRRPKKV